MTLQSKLPNVGTTIFTVMSALAHKHGAINLSQGYPDFDAPQALLAAVEKHMHDGRNQYPPMQGVVPLREAIARKVEDVYALAVDPEHEVTITAGATEALFCAIAAIVHPGDEVLVFDPAYDSYEPVVELQGGRTIHVPLMARSRDFESEQTGVRRADNSAFVVDWGKVEDAITPRTRLIIVNTPHNPTGSVWSEGDIQQLQALVAKHDLFVLADEVYEHIIFDGVAHTSMCRYPDLYARSFVVSSFGKTYHVTGWKVGYCVAPPELTREFRRVHQFVNFTVNTPMQFGLAEFLETHPEHHQQLGAFYAAKRDLFCELLEGSRFKIKPASGTYFQLLEYSEVTTQVDTDVAEQWTAEHGVASIPISVFYGDGNVDNQQYLRFCFAKDDATLRKAAEILCRL